MDKYFDELERIICVDPGQRGISSMWQFGSLKKSAEEILKRDKNIPSYVLTGFCCMFNRCETDGPLGSSILCSTLRLLGYNTILLTDTYSEPVVNAARNGNPIKVTNDASEINKISFIVSIERPGRARKTNDYRTMSGRDISEATAPLDLLFPISKQDRKEYLTIGVGDGGNEVGTGNIADEVSKNVNYGEDICTSICADILVMSGVSNWGALGISAALVISSNDKDVAIKFVELCNMQPDILQKMINAGSFDGCTGKSELSIDNMKYEAEHLDITNKIIDVIKSKYEI